MDNIEYEDSMMTGNNFIPWRLMQLSTLILMAWPIVAFAQMERFQPRDGDAVEIWRITNDPTVRDHANYHNTQCWSPDGRYLCFTHYAPDEKELGAVSAAEIHLYDLHENRDLKIDQGIEPRWANNHNWLFYVRYDPEGGSTRRMGTSVIWLDLDTNKRTQIAHGVRTLKETDCDDRWLYGIQRLGDGKRKAVRMPIRSNAKPEILPGEWGVGYNSLYVNPVHSIIVSRDHNYRDYYYALEGTRDIPFVARHFFDHDLDGRNTTEPFPLMEGSHFSWSGDGYYFLAGNGPVRGRKWDEPLPSNIHFLSTISVGDICPCGRSGRWICGSTGGGRGPLQLADTRSGDGWVVTKTFSFLCFPDSRDHSGPYDIDAKGSPDGTKIAFISTYDLKDGPATVITQDVAGDQIHVKSTRGFPEKGRLIHASGFGGELLFYERKSDTTFEGLKRGLYGTSSRSRLRSGQVLTSFESMLIPERLWKDLPLPSRSIRAVVKDMDSPLMRQRSSDIYVAVVRRPDRPYLRKMGNNVELIPGENHWETYGYHVLQNGKKITEHPIRPGEAFLLPEGGSYTAIAVERSGLTSRASLPLEIEITARLKVLRDKPSDFSWTHSRYLVDEREISEEEAERAETAVREIVHLHDGVIHRHWYENGRITRRNDLNLEGKPIRSLFYREGTLARREYWDRNGTLVSTEFFGSDDFITESIRFSGSTESSHWWYERGVPVKYSRRSGTFVKDGGHWKRTD